MKIAIVGTGVSGLTTAHILHKEHDVTVYEASDYIGGHVNTIDLSTEVEPVSIDTGFIVFNDWTYPNFEKLISGLDIKIQNSEMSFSASCIESGFEWSGSGLKSLIFNRENWSQLKPYQIFFDIVRFKKYAIEFLKTADQKQTLSDFLNNNNFSSAFIKYYILPMGAAIWSSNLEQISSYPAHSFLTFFQNHGLLNLKVRPQWKTIVGGSKKYVSELCRPFENRIYTNTPVSIVKRLAGRIEVFSRGRPPEYFDHIFFACHSDQALSLLDKTSNQEKSVLSGIEFQNNIAVLHTDSSLMPNRSSAWSSWNYLIPKEDTGNANVTYYMNRLQNLSCKKDYFVTLNPNQIIKPSKIIKKIDYMHPVFNQSAINSQQQYESINGRNNAWYCGAYWRNGFHEDGVWSAIRATNQFNEYIKNEELYIQRAS